MIRAPASKPTKWTRTPAGVVRNEIWIARTLLRFDPDADKSARERYTKLMEAVPDDDSEIMHAFAVAVWTRPNVLQQLREMLPRHFGTIEQLLQAVLVSSLTETNKEESKL